MADPKIPEHTLTPQGRIYGRASKTSEKLQEIGPEYRGHGATPEEKADTNKPWISGVHTDDHQNRDEISGTQPDVYAEEVNKLLGPITSAKEKIADTFGAAGEKGSGSIMSASKNSASETFSQYTQAAWEKVNDLKPTMGAKEPAKQGSSKESAFNQLKGEVTEEGRHDTTSIAEKSMCQFPDVPDVPDVEHKLLAAGGDDVVKVLADGGSTQDDPLEANMRATTEMLV